MADVMFVNCIPFFVTFSKNIKMTTTKFVLNRTTRQLAKSLLKVVFAYAGRGFIVNLALMDM